MERTTIDEAIKMEIFSKIGREYFRTQRQASAIRNESGDVHGTQILFQSYGLISAIDALGYDADEFHAYCKGRRKEWRKEWEETKMIFG